MHAVDTLSDTSWGFIRYLDPKSLESTQSEPKKVESGVGKLEQERKQRLDGIEQGSHIKATEAHVNIPAL